MDPRGKYAGLVRRDHLGIGNDYLVHFVGPGARDDRPVLVSSEIRERDSARRFQQALVLVLALREKGRGAENTEHRNGCRNEGKASDTRHGSACFYLLCLLFLRHGFRRKFGHLYFPSQKSL